MVNKKIIRIAIPGPSFYKIFKDSVEGYTDKLVIAYIDDLKEGWHVRGHQV